MFKPPCLAFSKGLPKGPSLTQPPLPQKADGAERKESVLKLKLFVRLGHLSTTEAAQMPLALYSARELANTFTFH